MPDRREGGRPHDVLPPGTWDDPKITGEQKDLFLEKERLFSHLESEIKRLHLPEDQEMILLERVSEHSIEDGLALAERVGFGGSLFLSIINTDRVWIKHLNFSANLAGEIERESKAGHLRGDRSDKLRTEEFFNDTADRAREFSSGNMARFESRSDDISFLSEDAQKLWHEIDEHYKQFLTDPKRAFGSLADPEGEDGGFTDWGIERFENMKAFQEKKSSTVRMAERRLDEFQKETFGAIDPKAAERLLVRAIVEYRPELVREFLETVHVQKSTEDEQYREVYKLYGTEERLSRALAKGDGPFAAFVYFAFRKLKISEEVAEALFSPFQATPKNKDEARKKGNKLHDILVFDIGVPADANFNKELLFRRGSERMLDPLVSDQLKDEIQEDIAKIGPLFSKKSVEIVWDKEQVGYDVLWRKGKGEKTEEIKKEQKRTPDRPIRLEDMTVSIFRADEIVLPYTVDGNIFFVNNNQLYRTDQEHPIFKLNDSERIVDIKKYDTGIVIQLRKDELVCIPDNSMEKPFTQSAPGSRKIDILEEGGHAYAMVESPTSTSFFNIQTGRILKGILDNSEKSTVRVREDADGRKRIVTHKDGILEVSFLGVDDSWQIPVPEFVDGLEMQDIQLMGDGVYVIYSSKPSDPPRYHIELLRQFHRQTVLEGEGEVSVSVGYGKSYAFEHRGSVESVIEIGDNLQRVVSVGVDSKKFPTTIQGFFISKSDLFIQEKNNTSEKAYLRSHKDGIVSKVYESILQVVCVGDVAYFIARKDTGEYVFADHLGNESVLGIGRPHSSSIPSPISPYYNLFQEHGYLFVTFKSKRPEDGGVENVWKIKIDEKEEKPTEPSTADQTKGDTLPEGLSLLDALPEDIKKKLELLSTLRKPDIDRVMHYFGDAREKDREEMRKHYFASPVQARRMTEMMHKHPEMFLDTLPAIPDHVTEASIRRIVDRLFPEARVNQSKDWKWANEGGFADSLPPPSAESCLRSRESFHLDDGDPKERDPQDIARFREPIEGTLVQSTAFVYDQNKWRQGDIRETIAIEEPSRELTATLPNIKGLSRVQLPLLLHAELVTDRVHGITKQGKEIPLSPTPLSGGRWEVSVPSGVEKIVYSQRKSDLPPEVRDISEKEYGNLRQKMAKERGKEFGTAPIQGLPAEVALYLRSLLSLPPKERLIAVQQYIQKIGYYDMDNRAALGAQKHGLGLADKLPIMADRMRDLKQEDPRLAGKQFAGVCAEFAELTAAALREAGFIAGILQGTNVHSGVSNTTNIHAFAVVLWPSPDGRGMQFVPVDATPFAATPEQESLLDAMRLPDVADMAAEREKAFAAFEVDAVDRLAELEEILKTNNEEDIRALTNGDLESVLNTILRSGVKGVKKEHTRMLNGILNASRYSLFNVAKMKVSDPESTVAQVEVFDPIERAAYQSFLSKEIKTIKAASDKRVRTKHPIDEMDGSRFFALIESFVDRFEKDTEDRAKAFQLVDMVLDAAKENLDPIESRAAVAVVQYLRAKKMAGKKQA